MSKLKVGFFGTGYVASTFVVGLERIKAKEVDATGVPLANKIPGYNIEDIEVPIAFDIDKKKIGKTMSDFVGMYPELKNLPALKNTRILEGVELKSVENMPVDAAGLEKRMTLSEAADVIKKSIIENDLDCTILVTCTEALFDVKDMAELESIIKNNEQDKITGSMFYAYVSFMAAKERGRGIAHINGIPSKVANSPVFKELAEETNSILIGDDISSGQSRFLSDFMEHYKEINRTMLCAIGANWGGNMDFFRLQDAERNESKKKTKTSCANDILGYPLESDIKPHGYLSPLGDKKTVFMHFPMRSFNGAEDEIYLCGRVNDSPAAAGMLVDMARLGKIAIDRNESGTADIINSFYCKWFGKQKSKILAYQALIKWLYEKDTSNAVPTAAVQESAEPVAGQVE